MFPVPRVPNEIASEILAFAFHVSDKEFTARADKSSFGQKRVPLSDLLLVNKEWLSIATPLLYEFVILRTTGQAEAFYDALRLPVGKLIKRFTRRIRLEGNFGIVTKRIFAALSGLTELFVCAPVHREEKVNGFCQGVDSLNITRVIVDLRVRALRYENSSKFLVALREAVISKLKSLETFEIIMPENMRDNHDSTLRLLCAGISKSPSLRKVCMRYESELFGVHADCVADEIAKDSSNKTLEIHVPHYLFVHGRDKYDFVVVHRPSRPDLDALEKLRKTSKIISTIINSHQKVFKRIIDYHLSSIGEDCEVDECDRMRRKRLFELMLVSRNFKKICTETRNLCVKTSSELNEHIAQSFVTDRLVEKVEIEGVPREDTQKDSIISALQHFPKATALSVAFDFSHYFSRSPGLCERLEVLELSFIRNSVPHFTAISQLPNLKTLDLDCFYWPDDTKSKNSRSRKIVFTNLRTLKLRGTISKGCLTRLLRCEFRNVDTLETLYGISGSHDRYEDYELHKKLLSCFPNLIHLYLTGEELVPPYLYSSSSTIRKITLDRLFSGTVAQNSSASTYYKPSIREREVLARMESLDFSGFPELQELQLMGVSRWPWSDHDLNGSPWVPILDGLVEKYAIKVTNRTGLPWRNRALTHRRKIKKGRN